MASILVLSSQEQTFSQIQDVLSDSYITLFANSASQLSDILVDGEISIVIIDASFLTATNQEAIVETLSFFPEVTLIAAVESGETKNIVDLFQSFEIYRYLQKPFSPTQVKKCIGAADKKYLKQKINSTPSNNDDSLIERKKNKYLIFVPVIIFLLIAFTFFFQNNKDNSIKATNTSVIEKQTISIEEKTYNNSGLLALEHEPINLSAKTGLPATLKNNEIEIIADSTNEAEKNNHYSEPEKNSETLIKKDSHVERLASLFKDKMSADNIIYPENDSAKYYLAKLKKDYPEYAETKELESSFISNLIKHAENSIKQNKFNSAQVYIAEIKDFAPKNESIVLLEQQIKTNKKLLEQKRIKQEQQLRIKKLSDLANKAIEDNNLIYPENLNAKYYLQSAIEIEPDNKKIHSQINTLAKLLLIQIETDINENTLASANSKIKIAKELGLKLEELSLLETKLNQALEKR